MLNSDSEGSNLWQRTRLNLIQCDQHTLLGLLQTIQPIDDGVPYVQNLVILLKLNRTKTQ